MISCTQDGRFAAWKQTELDKLSIVSSCVMAFWRIVLRRSYRSAIALISSYQSKIHRHTRVPANPPLHLCLKEKKFFKIELGIRLVNSQKSPSMTLNIQIS